MLLQQTRRPRVEPAPLEAVDIPLAAQPNLELALARDMPRANDALLLAA
jgi:hypothetical protein